MKHSKLLLILMLITTLNGFSQTKETSLNQTIKAGEAENIKVLVHIDGGQLRIDKAERDLAQVKLLYDKQEWTPTVSYTENSDLGKLIVKAITNKDEEQFNELNRCNISLNNNFNYTLGIVLGAGKANLNFEKLKIEKALFKLGVGSFDINLANTSIPFLKIEAGIGEATFDLSGSYKNTLKVDIKAGIGLIKIIVPKDIGVKFIVNGFLGSVETPNYKKQGNEYKNILYGDTKHSIIIRINGAIGTVEVVEK